MQGYKYNLSVLEVEFLWCHEKKNFPRLSQEDGLCGKLYW